MATPKRSLSFTADEIDMLIDALKDARHQGGEHDHAGMDWNEIEEEEAEREAMEAQYDAVIARLMESLASLAPAE